MVKRYYCPDNLYEGIRAGAVHEVVLASDYDATTARDAAEIERLTKERDGLREALASIAANTCCCPCREAALVARAALHQTLEVLRTLDEKYEP